MCVLGKLVAVRLSTALACGLLAAAIYFATGPRLTAASPVQASPTPFPETTRFLAAYACGDERTADALASPLYRAEWVRRGVSVADRMALRGIGEASPSEGASLHFEYGGGARSSEGFTHLLYLVTPIRAGAAGSYSAWRVDADPEGRVVWLELVWLFGAESREVGPVADAGSLAAVPVPIDAATAGLVPIAGVASEMTSEGHYILRPRAGSPTAEPNATSVRTYSVDSAGAIRPGAWSFGTGDWAVSTYPPSRSPGRRIVVAPEDEPLLEAYLRAIG